MKVTSNKILYLVKTKLLFTYIFIEIIIKNKNEIVKLRLAANKF